MDLNTREFLILLMVFAVALLPLRLGHAMPVAETDVDHLIAHHHADDGHTDCSPTASRHCAEHAPDGKTYHDCCGDQCAGVQGLVTGAFKFQSPAGHGYNPFRLQPTPYTIAFCIFRPPISLS